ncbi:hypothetical protein HZS_4631 [Henneguya salminicola]|nr:hypothetical protein HZS_4631 [Henneguya salminicola]
MASTLGLKTNPSKCAILPMTKSLQTNDLPYATITEDALAYKYLGIKEKSTPCPLLSGDHTQKSILASIALIMNTSLSARNKVKAININMFALSKLNFSLPFLIFPITACTELMKKKLQRLYLPNEQGGLGILCPVYLYAATLSRIHKYIQNSPDPTIQLCTALYENAAAYVRIKKTFLSSIATQMDSLDTKLGTNLRIDEKVAIKNATTNLILIESGQKSLHSKGTEFQDPTKNFSLKNNHTTWHCVFTLMALQDLAVPYNALLHTWNLSDSSSCRLCKTGQEWPSHVLGMCPVLKSLYIRRHDRALAILHAEIHRYLLNNQEICHSSTSDLISIQKDMPIDIIPHVRNNRPDIMVYQWKNKKTPLQKTKIMIIDLAITSANGIEEIGKKKRDTYTPLAKALEILHNATVEIIPVVISNLGGFSNALTNLKKIIPAALAQTTLKNMNTLVTREAVYIHTHFITLNTMLI